MRDYLAEFIVISVITASLFALGTVQTISIKAGHWIKQTYYSSVAVEKQVRGQFRPGNGIYLSNEFNGARLNNVSLSGDNDLTVTILPEHPTVKPNAWYGFKIWADDFRMITLKFQYPGEIHHRYRPKYSLNGTDWINAHSGNDTLVYDKPFLFEPDSLSNPVNVYIGPDTLWIAAHQIITSDDTYEWTARLSEKSFVNRTQIGSSRDGRPLYVLAIGNSTADKNIIVLARQYASMTAGHLAMKSFIEAVTDDSYKSAAFRNEYNIYLFPLVNPDGVDNGHWGHNAAGYNLSEEWGDSRQPETVSIKNYIESRARYSDNKFYLNIDFRSNQNSILYVFNQDPNSNMKGSTTGIAEMAIAKMPEYNPVIKQVFSDDEITKAEDYFYNEFGMESLVVIIDESSSEESVRQKGEAIYAAVIQKLVSPQLIHNQ